ncbi:hypothetical protein [[Micrococcus luteus] ATCC 49442]|uniref:hypothetical protein n=1 Tax=[Micrococcus luteus] ATCC 49442 TaxID=2698727 RepID=UPI0013DC602E|nr:hypothetical protein [[Micrococcus luteus] ATCC 49442]
MVDIYARLHLRARFWSRTVLLITLSVSAVSAGMNLVTLWMPPPEGLALLLVRGSTIASLVLVVASLAATVWGLDQRASDCNYAFRRLMSVKTKLRVASKEEAQRLQRDYADYGDDLPQIPTKQFTKLWDKVQQDRGKRHANRDDKGKD